MIGGGDGNLRITIEVVRPTIQVEQEKAPDANQEKEKKDMGGDVFKDLPPQEDANGPKFVATPPRDNTRVFVDVAAYNHLMYYVQGEVNAPGRLPWTGNETVLDAINYANGLNPAGDPHNIRLVRPARGKTPARIYPIDLQAITELGDSKANLQIFPGDRIIVGRPPGMDRGGLKAERAAEPVVIPAAADPSSPARTAARAAR
jgi:hypothetical protein